MFKYRSKYGSLIVNLDKKEIVKNTIKSDLPVETYAKILQKLFTDVQADIIEDINGYVARVGEAELYLGQHGAYFKN